MSKICIYHGNCADGFGAAWVVRRAAQFRGDLKDWEFYPGVYQSLPPDVTSKDVVIVDFSYKSEVIEQMLKTAKSILIIDHHKSAIEDLMRLEPITSVGMDIREQLYFYFDMNHSGAMLAWKCYFPNEEAPQLLKHIEDRDLWKFLLPGTREIQANLFSHPYDFDVWDDLMFSDLNNLIAEGKAIERKHFKDINELLAVCKRRMVIGGHNVPVASLPYTLTSDAGNIMAEGEPFAVCYYDSPDGRNFSLRSKETGIDVSEIAKMYGGGGHKHAAGFKVPFIKAQEFEISVNSNEA